MPQKAKFHQMNTTSAEAGQILVTAIVISSENCPTWLEQRRCLADLTFTHEKMIAYLLLCFFAKEVRLEVNCQLQGFKRSIGFPYPYSSPHFEPYHGFDLWARRHTMIISVNGLYHKLTPHSTLQNN